MTSTQPPIPRTGLPGVTDRPAPGRSTPGPDTVLDVLDASDELGISRRVADAARALADEPTLQQTLDRVVELAVSMVDGCESAGISLVTRRRIESPAVTDPDVARGDELQYALDEGPCLDAIRETSVVESGDVETDARWPRWAPRVADELGVRSMLCVQLYTSSEAHGALNMYSTRRDAFELDDQHLAATFAAVAAAAISAARTEEQLQSAVQTRTLIGQAQGILMERFSLTPGRAFAVLSRVSQDANIKLVEIAREIVDTRRVPGLDASPQPERS
ncbi:GAF and ANTAR domain-containing protein [Cellulosimicrobium marinum]|uniref:GAF and ANTAR domain-containing protein n=1 Tax=Cellulosimicrobium marinum TaxID=1638992 RepID=UPI001E42E54E|nr:GAF and ANTAR domain-containing protein [Cellulosimicrobium marinum]MCB7136109.1 GAF and ANTAR domain-containing protein [Cellulosimicrobium marinum]